MRILGTILAGGEGRRMGADKALVAVAGQPMIAHVVARLAPQVLDLAISANGDAARFAEFGLEVLPDAERLGPLAGVLAGLTWAEAHGATALVTAPCDGPIFPGDLVPRLCLAAEGSGAALAASGGDLHPTWALWPVTARAALADFLASGRPARLRDFAAELGAGRAEWPAGSFANANRPEDLAALGARLA